MGTISDLNMTLGFMWFCALHCGSCSVVAHWTRNIMSGLLVGWVLMPCIIWLMVRGVDTGCSVWREHRALRRVCAVSDNALERLLVERTQIKEMVRSLPGEPQILGCEEDLIPRLPWWDWCGITGRLKADWQEHFGLEEDANFMAQHEDLDVHLLDLHGQDLPTRPLLGAAHACDH